jgi:hypothetical protein
MCRIEGKKQAFVHVLVKNIMVEGEVEVQLYLLLKLGAGWGRRW